MIPLAHQSRRRRRVAALAYAALILSHGPVAYYRLGESSGTVAADASGNGRNGTYGGTVTFGAAGAIAGDADTGITLSKAAPGRVEITDPTLRDLPLADFSIEFWAHSSSSNSVSTAVSWHGGDDIVIYPFDANAGGNGFRIFWRDRGQSVIDENGIERADGIYRHFVVTRSGSGITLYVNGASAVAASLAAGTEGPFTGLWLGGFAEATQNFTGTLDEVAFYSRALTAAEILEHYNAGV